MNRFGIGPILESSGQKTAWIIRRGTATKRDGVETNATGKGVQVLASAKIGSLLDFGFKSNSASTESGFALYLCNYCILTINA